MSPDVQYGTGSAASLTAQETHGHNRELGGTGWSDGLLAARDAAACPAGTAYMFIVCVLTFIPEGVQVIRKWDNHIITWNILQATNG